MKIEDKKPIIFLMCGKAKHGKDTFSGYLKDVYEKNGKKVIITQLSKYIKYYAREISGWNLTEEDKPRELLQQLGTGVIREHLNKEDLFINRMIEDIEVFSCFYDVIIISDVRLKREIFGLKDAYNDVHSIHVVRPNFDNGLTEEQKMHRTEIDLDDYNDFDEEIINTTFDSLEGFAKNIYTKYER